MEKNKEQLISFELAKLAKEKEYSFGFGNGQKFYYPKTKELTVNHRGDNYPAPTQSLLQKWLREEHKIYVYVSSIYDGETKFNFSVYGEKGNTLLARRWNTTFKTYEGALEKALELTLRLL